MTAVDTVRPTGPQRGDAQEEGSAPSPRKFARLYRHPLFLLGLITVVGAALRLMYLDQPAIWGDESKTYMRACGSFQDLIDALARNNFSPLHDMIEWSIGRYMTLTPVVLRMVPAIAGTLMVPAVYFLAIQLVSRRTALLAALLAACSAYLLNYARDAKMYAECWLLVTLSMAFLLQWLRTRSRLAWYAWVICSMAMMGMQLTAAMVLPVEALIFLTHRRIHWRTAIFFILGMAASILPMALYMHYFNGFLDQLENDGRLSKGTSWVEPYNQGRDGLDLARYAGTAYLYGWEWARPVDEPQIRRRTLTLLRGAGIALGAILLLGVFPWRSFSTRPPDDPPAESWWRALLWLGAWLVLPAYGVYCASIRPPMGPKELFDELKTLIHAYPWVAGACGISLIAACFFCSRRWDQRLIKSALLLSVVAAIIALCWPVHYFVPVQTGSQWIPRYLGACVPAFIIAISVLLMRLPYRRVRFAAIALLLAVNLAQHGARVFADSEPPTGLMVADVLMAQAPQSDTQVYYDITDRRTGIGEPGMGILGTTAARYYYAVMSGKQASMLDIQALLWERTNFPTRRTDQISPARINDNQAIKRIIVWERLEPGRVQNTDSIQEKLSPLWKRTCEELYTARDHWTWRDLLVCRRRVYQRIAPPPLPPGDS